MSQELAIKNSGVYNLAKPIQVVAMAKVLQKHIVNQKLSVPISGKEYACVEGWQFAGGLMGMYPKITKVTDLSNDKEKKWMAEVEIIQLKDGKAVGFGCALCSNAEGRKKSFDEYAVLSMAQTRAIGKAYRNLIGYVMKLAGYESTSAEEIKPGEFTEKQAATGTQTAPTVDYLAQVKTKLFKMGATTEPQALKLLKDKTGLVWKSFKEATPKMAQMALASLLQTK